jgi:ABC-type multidrug transport system ATPase subunit/pSer/pThr/pTyr-binding forkhead associated (FHA) protein
MNYSPSSQPSFAVKVLAGEQIGITFPLNKSTITIGRDSKNDIVLNDPTVSRLHARLTQQGQSWTIEKLAASNTLKINARDTQQDIVSHQDTIQLGPKTSLVFLALSNAQPGARSQSQPQTPQTPSQALSQPFMPSSAPLSQPFSQPSKGGSHFTEVAPVEEHLIGHPSLEVSYNTSNDHQLTYLTKSVITIGRHPSNDIVIQAPVVSAFHAQIERNGNNGNSLVLVHPHPQARQQRTLNGLLYRGKHIRGDQRYRKTLVRGDVFRIGDENGTLVTLTFNDGSGAKQEAPPDIRPIQLNSPVITIGRHPDNMVVLTHPQVSAHHAQVTAVQDGHRLADLNSTNHVYINGQRTTGQLLKIGDEIRIGPYKFTYTGGELTQFDESASIRVDAVGLYKTGNKATVLLNNISLVIPPRKFVAVVGGSGAGKSTLMGALNGLRPAQQGKVLYNGQDYYRSMAAFSTQLGYVPQDDIVHRDLTVERALYYAAKLRLPSDFTEGQIKQRIDEVLEDVELEDRRDLLVREISGGQRKRVSIALELLAKPSIFFLDEPTSGLDPGLDRKMMFLLRKLADKGHTIVLVTHATNNINTCDYVCFLAAGGRLAYFGPPEDAKQYFNKTDFSEIYGALEPTKDHPDAPAQAEAAFRGSEDYRKYVMKPLAEGSASRATQQLQAIQARQQSKRGNPLVQFRLLSRRYVELLRNDGGNLRIVLLQAPIIGAILILILKFVTINGVFTVGNVSTPLHSADAQKVLFVMAFAAVMFGCINGAREIVKELPIYRRERTVNLGILPYLLSKIVVLGILCLLQSLVLVVMVSLIEPFHQSIFLPASIEVYITLALTSLAGLMVGLLVSSLAPNNDRAVSMIPLILIPQVIFAGTIFPLKSGLLQPVGLLFAVRWAMAALGTTIGLNGNYLGGDQILGSVSSYQYGHGANSTHYLLLLWLGLVIMIVLLTCATGYFLKRKDVKTS